MLILPERQMTHITQRLMLQAGHLFDVVALSRMTKVHPTHGNRKIVFELLT